MLRAYFDDSGTHARSPVVVVGGLVGSVADWERFEGSWGQKLAAPLPGKPPLKMFHLAACKAGDGEFEGYSIAERDAVTHDFRQIIIESNLVGVASAIERKAWAELVVEPYTAKIEADDLIQCVCYCIEETIRIAGPHPDGDSIAIYFDRGMWLSHMKEITDRYTFPPGRPRVVSISAVKVADFYPLQGADTVATESYWYGQQWLENGASATARAHFEDYLANVRATGVILGRAEIEGLLRHLDAGGSP